ncbi:MAG: hypothetical protein CMK23_01220 [Porticoccaceae bacterium]|nr:hypothetical protein [Porticoccaceae bacterium]MAK89531.1 hypothetical protein [Euryarchaeota archaeon]|tara:strand:- start:537 stop:845 length:309 start_codon:yes stop_codon:yes gene_type:complete
MGIKRVPRTPQFYKWKAFHFENMHIWEEFEKQTFELIKSGVTKSSPWLVINKMRWDHAIKTSGDDFKISNDFIAYYSRLFLARHPKHINFFTIKPLKGEYNG